MSNVMSKTLDGMVVSTPATDTVPMPAKKLTTEFVRGSGGSVAVGVLTDAETPEMYPETLVMQSTSARMVAAVPVEPEQGSEMKEVMWNEVKNKVLNITTEVRTAIDKLVDMPRAEVEKRLTKMVKAEKIGSFRILGPGESYSQDVVLDRVQVFTDKDRFVQSVQVG